MEPKHTPGPWENRKNKIFVINTYKSIATVHVQDNYEQVTFKPKEDVEAEANAKLIAAAPDLLDALGFAIALLKAEGTDENHRIFGSNIALMIKAYKRATDQLTPQP